MTFMESCNLLTESTILQKQFYSASTMTSFCHRNVMMLVLLDLSANFDTVDHNILLRLSRDRYGVRDEVLQWFES